MHDSINKSPYISILPVTRPPAPELLQSGRFVFRPCDGTAPLASLCSWHTGRVKEREGAGIKEGRRKQRSTESVRGTETERYRGGWRRRGEGGAHVTPRGIERGWGGGACSVERGGASEKWGCEDVTETSKWERQRKMGKGGVRHGGGYDALESLSWKLTKARSSMC